MDFGFLTKNALKLIGFEINPWILIAIGLGVILTDLK